MWYLIINNIYTVFYFFYYLIIIYLFLLFILLFPSDNDKQEQRVTRHQTEKTHHVDSSPHHHLHPVPVVGGLPLGICSTQERGEAVQGVVGVVVGRQTGKKQRQLNRKWKKLFIRGQNSGLFIYLPQCWFNLWFTIYEHVLAFIYKVNTETLLCFR